MAPSSSSAPFVPTCRIPSGGGGKPRVWGVVGDKPTRDHGKHGKSLGTGARLRGPPFCRLGLRPGRRRGGTCMHTPWRCRGVVHVRNCGQSHLQATGPYWQPCDRSVQTRQSAARARRHGVDTRLCVASRCLRCLALCDAWLDGWPYETQKRMHTPKSMAASIMQISKLKLSIEAAVSAHPTSPPDIRN